MSTPSDEPDHNTYDPSHPEHRELMSFFVETGLCDSSGRALIARPRGVGVLAVLIVLLGLAHFVAAWLKWTTGANPLLVVTGPSQLGAVTLMMLGGLLCLAGVSAWKGAEYTWWIVTQYAMFRLVFAGLASAFMMRVILLIPENAPGAAQEDLAGLMLWHFVPSMLGALLVVGYLLRPSVRSYFSIWEDHLGRLLWKLSWPVLAVAIIARLF